MNTHTLPAARRTAFAASTAPSAPAHLPIHELRLVCGQALPVRVQRGWVLHLQSGRLRLREPATSLAGGVWQTGTVLRAGAVWVAPCDGWVSLCALQPATRLLLKETSTPGLWARLWQALVTR